MSRPAQERARCPRKDRRPPSTSTTNPERVPRYAVSRTRGRRQEAEQPAGQPAGGKVAPLAAAWQISSRPARRRASDDRDRTVRGSARLVPAPPSGTAFPSRTSSRTPIATPQQAGPRSSRLTRASRLRNSFARIGISETAATAGAGFVQRVGRPLDPNLDPARPTVALDHDDRAQAPLDRFREFDLDRNLRLVDRLERPAVLPGQQLDPLCLGRLNPHQLATAGSRRW